MADAPPPPPPRPRLPPLPSDPTAFVAGTNMGFANVPPDTHARIRAYFGAVYDGSPGGFRPVAPPPGVAPEENAARRRFVDFHSEARTRRGKRAFLHQKTVVCEVNFGQLRSILVSARCLFPCAHEVLSGMRSWSAVDRGRACVDSRDAFGVATFNCATTVCS
jgi:hypothetical protein